MTDGNGGANYTVTFANNTTGVISGMAITVTAATNTRAYNGTTSAAAIPTVTSGTILAGDTANFTEVYSNKNAGTGKTLIPSGSVTDGNGGANYSVTFANNTTGVISALPITVTASANTRTYDGTTSAAAIPTVTAGAIQAGDAGSFTEAYADKNAGTGKTLIPSGSVIDGNSGANYAVTFANSTSGVINQAALTITAVTNSKTYDATATAAGTPLASGVQIGDSVTGLAETYDNAATGTGKTLTVTAYTINDSNSGNNYAVTLVPNTTGVIVSRLVVGVRSAQATPTWTAFTGAGSYNVYCFSDPGLTSPCAGSPKNVSTTSTTFTGLTNLNTYYFFVVPVVAANPVAVAQTATASALVKGL